jgi:hypothetical protein
MVRQGTFDPREKQEADETLNVNDDLNESVTNTNDLYEGEEEEGEEFADDLDEGDN